MTPEKSERESQRIARETHRLIYVGVVGFLFVLFLLVTAVGILIGVWG